MNLDVTTQKYQLRQLMRARRNALDTRAERAAAICGLVQTLPAYKLASALHCFLPIQSEPDTRPLLEVALAEGKLVAVPVIEADHTLSHSWITSLAQINFSSDRFGTLRPILSLPAMPGDWQLTIVPLLAFDREGYRLGYGKGYYDRLLGVTSGFCLGIAFACQEVDRVPREPHDRPLDMIITEEGVVASGTLG